MTIRTCDLPTDAFLRRYVLDGGYTDCYMTEVPGHVPLGQYVGSFYTTWLFKAERLLLSLAGHKSTDADAGDLARGEAASFAAWRVEDRDEDQLLMCDATGRTRSWFGVATISDGRSRQTLLYFGSGITAVASGKAGRKSIGPLFLALTGFHKLYSKALLTAARRKILRAESAVEA
ncbi:MAG: hypothetical protein JJU24_13200 [Natronohydrobacter sp.]|nr:hypothetical protein [Natronohydrobacter sp.]